METIKIDPDGKYILIVEGKTPLSDLDGWTAKLNAWWKSDAKFGIVAVAGYKVRVERVDNGTCSADQATS